jgi:hypothetical protein
MSSQLSVCLLTRDEERNIERAIRSVEGVADEVVVADAGSTDRTEEIARDLGARVVPFAWDDDFAQGRNFAIGKASGDWVLWLNPDEELLPPGRERVRPLIDSGGDVFGYLAQVQDVPRGDRLDQFSETWDIRLYRRRPDLRYVGRLHPSLAPELAQIVAQEGRQVVPSEVVIRRHAYMSVLDASKLRWAVRLLERELKDRPGQLHYLIEYGRNLLLLNDPKGHEVMAEAIEQVIPSIEAPAPPSPDVQLLLDYVLTTPPERSRCRITPNQAMTLALRWFPNSPPLLWTIAGSYFRARQFGAAAVLLEQLVQSGRTGAYDHSQKFDPRIIGPWALLNLGECHRALNNPESARRCFQPLLSDPEYGAQAAKHLAEVEGGSKGE